MDVDGAASGAGEVVAAGSDGSGSNKAARYTSAGSKVPKWMKI
jgi:hypothetical protein